MQVLLRQGLQAEGKKTPHGNLKLQEVKCTGEGKCLNKYKTTFLYFEIHHYGAQMVNILLYLQHMTKIYLSYRKYDKGKEKNLRK